MTTQPTNNDDIIDSRDVIARVEELRETIEDAREASDEPETEDLEELRVLEALADEASDAGDWEHGNTLIRESYFQDYAKQLAEDIGAISNDAQWPLYCIDWELAAQDLRVDYTEVDFDGVPYLIRAC